MKIFSEHTIYVLVKKNHLRVRHLESKREATFEANPPFTTSRLLVGDFVAFENLLRGAVKEVSNAGFFSVPPRVVMQPLEMTEGGLAPIEERILKELAIGGARASKVVVWVGAQLSDSEVSAKVNGDV